MKLKFLPPNYHEYVAAFIGHLGVFIAALSMTWPSPTLPKLTRLEDNPLQTIISSEEKSLLGSISILGSFFGTFISSYLAKVHGRRLSFLILGIPALLAYILMSLSTHFWELMVARILTGYALGGFFSVNTMYFAEIASDSNRGFLGTVMTCFINFGLLFVLMIGPWTSFVHFHIILAVFPAIFILLVYIYLPESPYYLIQRDNKAAEHCLQKLRGKMDVKDELENIKETLGDDLKVNLRDVLRNKGLRRGLIIGCGLVICQQLSATAVIMSYGQTIFEEAGGNVPSEVGPIIIASIQFFVGFIAPSIVDKSGRRLLLLVSYIGITAAFLIFGFYFYSKNSDVNIEFLSWVPLASLVLYISAYSLGSGPLPWTIIGEIFPLEAKSVATSVCITVLNIMAFIFLFGFNLIKDQIGIGVTFWIFGVFSLMSTVFIYYFVIETKGMSLADIQKILNT